MNQVGGALTGGISTLAGMALQPLIGQQQQNQQQALINQQLNANEALSAYNYQQQYDLWQKTNYPAQVQQLQQAGLNPALLYAKGGPGGTTGTPTTGAGMGIAPGQAPGQTAQQILAAQETAADIKLKNAQAENIAAKTPQEADLMTSTINSINQGINNQKAQEILTDAQAQTQRLTNSLQGETLDDQIATIRALSGQIQNEMQRAVRNNYMDQATMNDKIKTIQGAMIGQFLQNNLTQSQTSANKEQIQQMQNQIMQGWKQLDINKQNANTQEAQHKLS